MSDALATQLARALNIPPDAARHTLNHLVAALHEQLDATGKAEVPGLGTFLREGSGLAFRPDDALARAVNHRYAGLRPIAAEPRKAAPEPEPDDPFAEVDLSTPSEPEPSSAPEPPVGFQPLDTLVEAEESEPEEEVDSDAVDEAPIAPTSDESPMEPVGDADRFSEEAVSEEDVSEPPYPEEVQELPEEEQPIGETNDANIVAAESEDEDAAAEAPFVPDAVPPVAIAAADRDDIEREPDHVSEDEAALEPVPTGDETFYGEGEPVAEADGPIAEADEPVAEAEVEREATMVPPVAESEEEAGGLDDLSDLDIPATAAEDEDFEDDLDTTSIFPTVPASEETAVSASAYSDKPPADARTVAPAVAATSASAPDREPAEPAPRRGVPIVGMLIGLAAILGVVALLWLLNREPDGPAIAERPVPTDTTTAIAAPPVATDTTAASAPTDTAVAAAQPPADAAPADPLRGDGIDRADGGFSWVVGSELSREPAEQRVAAFRAQGLRAGVIAEEAAGRTRYRVALGQFESIEQAERFRSDLPAGVPADTWLLRL